MPLFYDEANTRALNRQPQPQLRVGGVVQNPVPPATYGEDGYWSDVVGLLEQRLSQLATAGLSSNASVLVVGAGFGHEVGWLRQNVTPDVWGIEPGGWFWDPTNAGLWWPGVQQFVAEDWLGSGTYLSALQALPGVSGQARFGWVVDADAAVCHTDAELPVFVGACEDRLQGNAKGRIWHFVSDRPVEAGPFSNTGLNSKTIAEWSLTAVGHRWASLADSGVWTDGTQVF